MLEKEAIQQRGFRNIIENGKKSGYQIRVRSLYYRGLWLSQITSLTLKVDGELIDNSIVRFCVDGKDYTIDEMKSIGDVHWDILNPAIIKVEKDGGLEAGAHEIEFDLRHSSSYMPPDMDWVLSTMGQKREIILVQ